MSKAEEKKKFWTEEIRSFQKSGQSYVKYCESKGFCASTLRYWEAKFGLGQRNRVADSGFSKVEVNKDRKEGPSELPSAKWVAEDLRYFHPDRPELRS